jgi:hypothetical protein
MTWRFERAAEKVLVVLAHSAFIIGGLIALYEAIYATQKAVFWAVVAYMPFGMLRIFPILAPTRTGCGVTVYDVLSVICGNPNDLAGGEKKLVGPFESPLARVVLLCWWIYVLICFAFGLSLRREDWLIVLVLTQPLVISLVDMWVGSMKTSNIRRLKGGMKVV